MKTVNQAQTYEILIEGAATTQQVAARVAQSRREHPERAVLVFAKEPEWRQARAAFAAGASDYLPQAGRG